MAQILLRFYAELNDFLPYSRRQVSFLVACQESAAVKDAVEAAGVPHTEVDLILVNGASVDFHHPLHDGDRVSVYPVFEGLDISPLVRLRPAPLRVTRFVLDTHLGRLAATLRLLGFDSLYRNDADDADLAATSAQEHRILLTRDRGLLKRRCVTHGYCVRSSDPRQQAHEVVRRFDLARQAVPFHRCLRCNGLLEPVSRETVSADLPPGVRSLDAAFHRCAECRQVYWPGSHYTALQKLVADVLKMDGTDEPTAGENDKMKRMKPNSPTRQGSESADA